MSADGLTWVAFAQHFDGGGHFLLADSFILLPLGGSLEPLPGQGAQVKVHEDVAEGLQVISPRLLCEGQKKVEIKIRGKQQKGKEIRRGSESTVRIGNLVGPSTLGRAARPHRCPGGC